MKMSGYTRPSTTGRKVVTHVAVVKAGNDNPGGSKYSAEYPQLAGTSVRIKKDVLMIPVNRN